MAIFRYPSISISTSGLATEAKQDTIITKQDDTITELQTIAALDFATETTQTDVLGVLKPVKAHNSSPVLLDTSSTNIPGSASLPLELIASTAGNTLFVDIVEDIGEFMGLYTGAASSEVLYSVLPLGGGRIPLNVPAATRISIRAMGTSAISIGQLALTVYGY